MTMFLTIIAISFLSLLQVTPTPGRPDSLQTLLVKAGLALNQKEYIKARDYYDAAYQLDSNNVETLRNLAMLLSMAGDRKGAVTLLKRAESLAPNDPSILNNLGTIYSNREHPDTAATYFERALQFKPNNPTYMTNLALEYSRLGRNADAMKLAKQAIALDTTTVDIPMILGDCFAQDRRYDSADVYYTRAIMLGGKTSKLYYQRGYARQNLRRLGEAEFDYRESIARDSACRDCRQTLGVLYVTRGQYQDALDQFEQVVKLDSTYHNGMISLGVMYAMTGRGAQADSMLYRLMAIDSALGYRMVDLITLENSKQQKKK